MNYDNKPSSQSAGAESPGAPGVAARVKERIAEGAADVKERVTNLGRTAADRFNESRLPAAGALDQTASSLHSGGDRLSGVAHSAAEKVQATADYVRRTDLKGMAEDVRGLVRRYPGRSLAAAAVLGFFLARSLRSRD